MTILDNKTEIDYKCKICDSMLRVSYADLEIYYKGGYETDNSNNIRLVKQDLVISFICPCCKTRNDATKEFSYMHDKISKAIKQNTL